MKVSYFKNFRFSFVAMLMCANLFALFVGFAYAEPPFVVRNSRGDTLLIVDENAIILKKALKVYEGNKLVSNIGADSVFFDITGSGRALESSFSVGGGGVRAGEKAELMRLTPHQSNQLYVIEQTLASDDGAIWGQQAVTDYYGVGVFGQGGWTGMLGYVFPFPTGLEENVQVDPELRVYNGVKGIVFPRNDLLRKGEYQGVTGFAQGSASNIGVYGNAGGLGDYNPNYENDQGDLNFGVFARARDGNDGNVGLYGYASGAPTGNNFGVYGTVNGLPGGKNYGVYGYATGGFLQSYAIYGEAGNASNDWAGWFKGDINVTGKTYNLSSAMRIDNPQDPANQYLEHAVVHSDELTNLYSGNIVLDGNGEALVQMPDWFDALNTEVRYQLTPIGASMPSLYIAKELSKGEFKIAGGVAGKKVSWALTSVRKDPYAKAHPMSVEVQKSADERGKYLSPELYNQPLEKQIGRIDPEARKQIENVGTKLENRQ